MQIQLSDHFDYSRLLRFTLPSIAMMVFTSIYSVVDGYFVSNYAGKQPLAAVNMAWPVIMMLAAVGMMFGTGGSALIAAAQGRGRKQRANEYFSLIVYVVVVLGFVLLGATWFLMEPIMRLLGAEGGLLTESVFYGQVCLIGLPAFIMQMLFQSLFITAEKPQLGFYVTVGAGVANMVLDWVLIGLLGMGLFGAALATDIGFAIGGLIPLFYFARKNSSTLQLGRTSWKPHALLKASFNGCSEMLSGITSSVVTLLYNFQLLRYAGENGVAAFSVIMYVTFIFFALFIGFSSGVAPVISYHFGARNKDELRSLLKRCAVIIGCSGLLLFAIAQLSAPLLSRIFVGYDDVLCNMTVYAFRIVCFTFLISGFNIFGSSLFTALNNGFISATISTSRSVIFEAGSVLLFPLLFGLNGIWFACWGTELAALTMTIFFIIRKRKTYGYL
ncbi:MAG: MATE family efflux transporter [Fibrobacter sp.]|nr:MATE family efflux transporter [Fibrobacter sp.]